MDELLAREAKAERRMIMENQRAIMNALIVLVPDKSRALGDLYYHTAKITGYLGPEKTR